MSSSSWTYGLITPDGLLTESYDSVTKRLEANGFEIVAGRQLQMSMDLMHRMYHHTDDPPPATGVEELPPTVMGQLYFQAPSLLLILTHTGNGAAERLLRCKGDKRPILAHPDSVRRAGEHLIFNHLHSPDDAASAAIELQYLVGAPEAAGLMALAQSRERSQLVAPLLGPDAIRESLPSFSGWDVLSYPLAANRIRRRILQQLAIAGHTDNACTHLLLTSQQALNAERSLLERAPAAVDRLRVSIEASSAIHAALLGAESHLGVGLEDGLVAIAGLFESTGARDLDPIYALSEHGIYMSPLEKLALEAHRHALRADEEEEMKPPKGIVPMLGAWDQG